MAAVVQELVQAAVLIPVLWIELAGVLLAVEYRVDERTVLCEGVTALLGVKPCELELEDAWITLGDNVGGCDTDDVGPDDKTCEGVVDAVPVELGDQV